MGVTQSVTWTPTQAEVRALARGAARVVLRRSLAWLAGSFGALAVALLVTDGPLAAAFWAGLPFVALVGLYVVVTRRRNLRVVSAAYPVGVEARAETSDVGLLLVTAMQTTQIPWGRFVQPRVDGAVVSVRDTVTGRRAVLPRALLPDAWIARLDA